MGWLDLIAPWEPSVTVVTASAVAAALYVRGRGRTSPSAARQIAFWTGLIMIYAALHTRLDYYAQREFFIHRLQHLLLHHVGPFLIALAAPGATLAAGIPPAWRQAIPHDGTAAAWSRKMWRTVTNPVLTGILFVGLIWLWLIPTIHFYAMLDVRLYRLMNWSMAIDGILFWVLVLDSRPCPPARFGPGVRLLLQAAVVPPQIACGALITFANPNLYPLYDVCGRAFPGVSAAQDQTIGGLILWIPATMMSLIGILITLYVWFNRLETDAPAIRSAAAIGS